MKVPQLSWNFLFLFLLKLPWTNGNWALSAERMTTAISQGHYYIFSEHKICVLCQHVTAYPNIFPSQLLRSEFTFTGLVRKDCANPRVTIDLNMTVGCVITLSQYPGVTRASVH